MHDSADDEEWEPEEASADTFPCPHCGRDVYEQAERCPYCGQYISEEESSHRKARWIVIAAIATIAAIVLHWVFGRR
jgi:predicted RNA-binding Zn-ribbon protein involved in translation (DUF1610 family)